MKKMYSLLSFALLTATVSTSQVNIQDYNGGSPSGSSLNGTTITRTVSEDELVLVDMGVTNTSGLDKYFNITRVKITDVPAWSGGTPLEQISWGYNIEGNCYSLPFSSNPWTSLTWDNPLPDGETGNLRFGIHTNSSGTIHYRFYITESSVKVDSVDVIVTTTLGIKDSKKDEEIAMSIYPNPASSVLNISAKGLDGNYDVRMTDVLGKVVYNESVVGTSKKVDVSDFKSGVYLVTITEKGTAIQTRRTVVKH